MFTLQILDRGQTFLHTIEDRALLLGSGAGADVMLREEGVDAAHARLEPKAGSVRLVALATTKVNGQAVAQVDLALGDRIEIGRAVLIVGRTVARAAVPEDVLADSLPRESRRQPVRKQRPLLPVLTVLAAAGVVVWLLLGAGGAKVADEIAAIRRARQDGHIERALASIEKLQRVWADATDDRLQRLAAEREAVRGIETAIERLTNAVLDPAVDRSYAEWSQELRAIEIDGDDTERVAARRVRSQLTETLSKRPKAKNTNEPALAGAPSPRQPAPPAPPPTSNTTAQPDKAPTPAAVSPPPLRTVDLAEVDQLCTQGLFAQAIALLQAKLAATDEAGVVLLQTRTAAVREAAREAMAKVLDDAAQAMRGGKPADAVRLLQSAQHRFPATGEFAAIPERIAAGEAAVAAAARAAPAGASGEGDAVARAATLSAVRAQMDAVRTAEEKGAFADAAQRLRAAAAGLRDRDPGFADRLLARAEEAELLASWHDAVAAALQGGRKIMSRSRSGAEVEIVRVDGGALLTGPAGETRITWLDLTPAGVQSIADQLVVTGRPALGAAALMYKAGDNTLAEALLATQLQDDAALKEHVDRVIARGRGEPLDARGYTLGKDGFVSARSLELQKEAQKFAVRVDVAMRDKPAVRAALVAEAKAAGADAVQVLVIALQKEFGKQVQKLETSPLKKQLDRVDRQRVALDDARKNARDLIYDEVKYFYPYRPPAVSSDRFAEYSRVQAEVDRRVAALRTLWEDERTKVRVPSSLRADLERLDWVANELAALGELDYARLAGVGWARSLPAGDSITVRNFCRTEEERAELEEWQRVEAYNQLVGKDLSSPQREQLRVTNEYRAMFRHQPLAIVKELCAASQGHAEEMSRLGYFAHESPTPGRKWPHDRTRAAGYPFGSSENIALTDGAQGAHDAWCHSSGHHRNLLQPNHREIGIGADGRYWVQNFGSGRMHCDHPCWEAAGTRKR